MYDADTKVQQLQSMADAGASLPSLVILRGVVSADGPDVQTVSDKIDGLKSMVGTIDQPENDFLKIAQAAKTDPGMKRFADQVANQTGIKSSDIPDVVDDYSHAQVSS